MACGSKIWRIIGIFVVAGVFAGSFYGKPAMAASYAYVSKSGLAGYFGYDNGFGNNKSYYYYVDGELALCGDAEYGGESKNLPYSQYNDDIAKAVVLAAIGKAPGYSINSSLPRTSDYALYHSILSVYLHPTPLDSTNWEHVGWTGGHSGMVSTVRNEAYNIYNWVQSNYPGMLEGYTLYRTSSGYTTSSGYPMQQIYFVEESSINVDFYSSSSVKNSDGASVENKTFKVKESELDTSTMVASTTLTFSHYITPSSYGANNGQFTRIRTTVDGVDNGTIAASGTNNSNTVNVSVNLGEVKKVCQYAYFSPSSITLSTSGALLGSNSAEKYSSACTSVSADLDANVTSFVSTTRVYDETGADKTDDSDNRYILATGKTESKITFRHSLEPRTFGTNNAHYYDVVTIDNGREIASHTKALGGTELDYVDEVTIHVGAEEKHKICQYIYFSPINVTSLAGSVISSTPSTTKNSYACMYLISGDKAEYEIGTEVE